MGHRTVTRRISTAAAATGLMVGAGVGLAGGTAQAQEPTTERPSVAELCAAHYHASSVSAAAHTLRDLRAAWRSGDAPVRWHGLRCGQVAGAATSNGSGSRTDGTDGTEGGRTSDDTTDTTSGDSDQSGSSTYGDDSNESAEHSSGDHHESDSWSGDKDHADGEQGGADGYRHEDGYGYRHHDGYRHHGHGHHHGYGHHEGYGHHD